MFENLRLRLTLWFVILAALVYLLLTLLGVGLFYSGLTKALDEELEAIGDEIVPSIDYDNGSMKVMGWNEVVQSEPRKLTATIQLYDLNGKLLAQYGPPGAAELLKGTIETKNGEHELRSMSSELQNSGKSIGFIQVQLSTRHRKEATDQFIGTLLFIAPLLLFGLGVCGYFFSGKVSLPVETSFSILRRFLADAGHELATPITIIQASLENLEADLGENHPHKERIGVMGRSTSRMERLVKDLVLLAKMDSHQRPPQMATVELNKVISSIVEEFKPIYKDKQIELVCTDLPAVSIIGDADSMHTMFSNLLENCARYTDSGGVVTIGLSQHGNFARIIVSDTGIGIPADSIPFVFDRFFRVDQSRSRAAGGSGLGLSIVKAVIESHRGSVVVESDLGKGSIFTIELPLS